jgi:hypothetical protein
VRSFAATILRRGIHDATALADTAHHLVDFPKSAGGYRAGRIHTANLRTILKHRQACGLAVLQAHEDQLQDGVLVFRDPHGRTITIRTQVLTTQLDLLHRGQEPSDTETTGRAQQLLTELGGWPDTPTTTAPGDGPDTTRHHHPDTTTTSRSQH